MIDTIRLEITGLSSPNLESIKNSLDTLTRVSNEHGELKSIFTQGELQGSWDYRIRAFVSDIGWQSIEEKIETGRINEHRFYRTKKRTIPIKVPEFLVIEFSLAKWATGHNLDNSSLLQDLVRLVNFRKWLMAKFRVTLPSIKTWYVTRLDIANNYNLGSFSNTLKTVSVFKGLNYPRRKNPRIFDTSVKWSGLRTLKVYCKGPEYKKNDKKRLVQIQPEMAKYLQSIADNLLRIEIEFRKKALHNLDIITVDDIFQSIIDFEEEMKNEIKKLTQSCDVKKAYTLNEAMQKIRENHKPGKGISVESAQSVWVSLATQGGTYANKMHGRDKVKRAKRFFNEIGLSVITSFEEKKIDFDIKHIQQIYNNEPSKDVSNVVKFQKVPYYDEFRNAIGWF